jgi:hypothetical protein
MSATVSDWSATDVALLGGALGAIYADVQTTKYALARGRIEMNPLFRTPRPSGEALDQAGLLTGGLATLAATVLPPLWRGMFLGGIVGLEGELAYQNSQAGVSAGPRTLADGLAKPIAAAALAIMLTWNLSHAPSTVITPGTVEGAPAIAYNYSF